MTKKKLPVTIEECNAEMELAQKQLRQYENRGKMLDRKISIEKRKGFSEKTSRGTDERIIPLEQRAHLYTLSGVVRSAEGFISAQGTFPALQYWRLAPHRGSYTSPATAYAVYPFVYLRKANTLLRKLFTFHKSEYPKPGGGTIAIYHCSIKIVSRGKGKSAVAAAAYRSGEKITNEWDGLTHDYTRKGGVVHSEILLPPHAPPSFSDRKTLWNSVELYEKSNNAQLAREVEIALPVELSREEQTRLVREYCSSQFVSKGMCADFNIHDTGGGNPHAHILLTMRPIDERGAWAAKSKKEYVLDEQGERVRLPSGRFKTRKVDLVDWNSQENAEHWRKAWADISNAYLERAGSVARIDHRSNAERGIDELPTVHLGVAASQMEKKGVATEKGEINRMIRNTNRLMREIKAQMKRAIANLIQNCINHNENGCTIYVSVDTDNENCIICIEDSGVGASDELIDKLNHTPHYMVCDANTTEQRHGLGLLIVKQIVSAHNGTIIIGHSSYDGFSVKLTLPIQKQTQNQ